MSPYCRACGAETAVDANYCSSCGEAIGGERTQRNDVVDEEPGSASEPSTPVASGGDPTPVSDGIDTADRILLGIIAVFIATIPAFILSGIALGLGGIGGIAATVVVWLLVAAFMVDEDSISDGIGLWCYVTAFVVFATPTLFYVPRLFAVEPTTPYSTGFFIGSVLGVIVWTIVFGIVAFLVGIVGYALRRYGE